MMQRLRWLLAAAGLLALVVAAVLIVRASAPEAVRVVLAPTEGGRFSDYRYVSVNRLGVVRDVTPFTPDETERFDLLFDSPKQRLFSDKVGFQAVSEQLERTRRRLEAGELEDARQTAEAIRSAARGTFRHDLVEYDLLRDGETWFAEVQLNVNWQSPCVLYVWEPETRRLRRLASWQSVELVGLALP